MYTRYLSVALTFAMAITSLGYANSSSAAPPGKCSPWPSCKNDEPPDPDPGATFTVRVFLEGNTVEAGSAVNFEGKISGNRRGVGEAPMTLSLIYLETLGLPGCNPGFGSGDEGLFSVSTYQDPGSGFFTYIEANFYNFEIDGVRYSLAFGPDKVDQISGEWLPGTGVTATLTGAELTLKAMTGPAKKGPCNGPITQNWRITVLGE